MAIGEAGHQRGGEREAAAGGRWAILGWESAKSIPTYGKNPGESQRGERTERRERSQAHQETQTQSPGGGLRGPLQLKGSPVDRVIGAGGL